MSFCKMSVARFCGNNIGSPEACSKGGLCTEPMGPGTSAGGDPIRAHLTELLDINGFLAVLFDSIASVKPTPAPAPADTIDGVLGAGCLEPGNIINAISWWNRYRRTEGMNIHYLSCLMKRENEDSMTNFYYFTRTA